MKNQNEGKNIQMDFKQGISHFKAAESDSTIPRQNSNLTTGRKDLPEIYILVLVSCLYSFFIRVGGNFIIVSGIVAYFLFVCRKRAHILLSMDSCTFIYISVTVSIVIVFCRGNYNNRLLLNNLTRRLESDDVDEK